MAFGSDFELLEQTENGRGRRQTNSDDVELKYKETYDYNGGSAGISWWNTEDRPNDDDQHFEDAQQHSVDLHQLIRRHKIYGSRHCNQSIEGFEEYPLSHNCVVAFSLQDDKSWTPYNVLIYGYVHPAVVAATMVTNCLVCAVLLRRTMRSPTSTLLVAMAASDAMTGLIPTPCFIAFHTFQMCFDWVPYEWCVPYILLTDHLPTVFHTASVWLTVALAAQRYVQVCHPAPAKRLCTVRNMVRVIVVVYLAAFCVQLPRMVDLRFGRVLVQSQLDPTGSQWFDGCYFDYVPVVLNNLHLYFGLNYWFRVVLANLIPCAALVILNAVLARTMAVARRRRSQLLSSSRRPVSASASIRSDNGGTGEVQHHNRHRSEYRRLGDGIATTLMLMVVVGLLLLVELPLACFLILVTLENTWNYPLLPENAIGMASLFINLLILLSYPVNFFIYCGMSRQFRKTFAAMFTGNPVPTVTTSINHHAVPAGGADRGNHNTVAAAATAAANAMPDNANDGLLRPVRLEEAVTPVSDGRSTSENQANSREPSRIDPFSPDDLLGSPICSRHSKQSPPQKTSRAASYCTATGDITLRVPSSSIFNLKRNYFRSSSDGDDGTTKVDLNVKTRRPSFLARLQRRATTVSCSTVPVAHLSGSGHDLHMQPLDEDATPPSDDEQQQRRPTGDGAVHSDDQQGDHTESEALLDGRVTEAPPPYTAGDDCFLRKTENL